MSRSFQYALLWLGASALALVFALSWLPAAFDGTGYVPIGADSFYHARRILDAAADPGAYYQFDRFIHAPDGSLLTWPWAYDLLAGLALRLALCLDPGAEPMALLAYLPVAFVAVNAGLVTLIARGIGLPVWASAVLLACYATSPLTRELHAAGRLDHHFLEHLFFLAALYAALRWLQSRAARWALATGAVLGLAPAFHNGLFVLQLFLAGALTLLWLRRMLNLAGTETAFAAALLAATLAAVLPSEALRRFEWGFYYLGWFHLAAATLSAAWIVVLARSPRRARTAAVLTVLFAAAATIAWSQIEHGGRFVFASMPALSDVTESQSLLEAVAASQHAFLTERYSALLWIMPVVGAGLAVALLAARTPTTVLVCATLLAGGFLAAQQLRLHYFGSLALFVPVLAAAAAIHARLARGRQAFAVAVAAGFAVAIAPSVRTFGSYPPLAGDVNYALHRSLLERLGTYCERDPGVVLARFGDGHYLRYHTDCPVIANNMIMTAQHLERISATESMFSVPAAELRANYPWIRYVFVWRQDNAMLDLTEADVRAANPRLAHDLLLAKSTPPGFERLGEVALSVPDRGPEAIARIYRIAPAHEP